MGINVQVCWEKLANYWDVEMRLVPMEGDRFNLSADEAVKRCDENTIGVLDNMAVRKDITGLLVKNDSGTDGAELFLAGLIRQIEEPPKQGILERWIDLLGRSFNRNVDDSRRHSREHRCQRRQCAGSIARIRLGWLSVSGRLG